MRTLTIALAALSLLTACGSAPAPAAPADQFLALGIANAAVAPMPQVFCSGQATAEQFAKLPGVGITRVVSLRPASEPGTGWEEAKAKELGIEFVRLPITGADDLTDANVDALSRALAAQGPTLVACGSSNRVGALLALKARRDGSTPEQALQIGKQCGLNKLEPVVKQKLGQ